jgi:hypothetical protein
VTGRLTGKVALVGRVALRLARVGADADYMTGQSMMALHCDGEHNRQ